MFTNMYSYSVVPICCCWHREYAYFLSVLACHGMVNYSIYFDPPFSLYKKNDSTLCSVYRSNIVIIPTTRYFVPKNQVPGSFYIDYANSSHKDTPASYESDGLGGWYSTLKAAWYVRRVCMFCQYTFSFFFSFFLPFFCSIPGTIYYHRPSCPVPVVAVVTQRQGHIISRLFSYPPHYGTRLASLSREGFSTSC